MVKDDKQIRVSPEFQKIISFIKAKHILEEKKPPTAYEITKRIAKKISKEDLWYHDFCKE